MNNQLILLVALLLFASCAPLRPLGPETPKGYTKYNPNASYKKRPETSKSKQQQDVQTITGIVAWDIVLSPWLDTPYLLGGTTKNGVDCSGFTSNVYREKAEMSIPRTSVDQSKMGISVNRKDLVVGDLIFFGDNYKVSHVGIYVGKGNFIHASTSKGVTVTPLDDSYWESRYIGARRYL
jgi:probable lipoprotein NlpC